jgi:patatin-like phospholipase/acyl hydrolase
MASGKSSSGYSRRRLLTASATAAVATVATSVASDNRARAQTATPPKFRVLSLDGGGVRGYLTAIILAHIETELNKAFKPEIPLGHRFDLIAGTSIGGITALGLAIGKKASEILELYEKQLRLVFEFREQPWIGSKSKYTNTMLRKMLREFFEDKVLKEVNVPVCITSVSLPLGEPSFYRSYYENAKRLNEKLRDIALATSAAPSYFPAYKPVDFTVGDYQIDGGVCANNPAVVAIIESLKYFQTPLRPCAVKPNNHPDIVMLSLGTGKQNGMPYKARDMFEASPRDWAPFITDVIFESQAVMTDEIAGYLLGQNYLRINPQLKVPIQLDDVSQLGVLAEIATKYTRQLDLGFLKKYFAADATTCPSTPSRQPPPRINPPVPDRFAPQ